MKLSVNNVSKKINQTQILKNIFLEAHTGEVCGIVGHNGSGKTMLFRAICGFIKLDSGHITIDERPVKFGQVLPVKTGLVIETSGFIGNVSGFDNLKYLAKLSDSFYEERIVALLKRFDLYEVRNKKVKTYSLGMKQKLAIIQSVMEDQQLLIFDEPTNGLDKDSVMIFNELIFELKVQGKIVLIASHHESEIASLIDSKYEMSEGILTKKT